MQSKKVSGHRAQLSRMDALIFEQHLTKAVRTIIPFESQSITFPRKEDSASIRWIPEEKRLLLPLPDNEGNLLGIFSARGVKKENVESILPYWSGISSLISENLLHYKRSLCDPITGLYARHYLLACLERDLDASRIQLSDSSDISFSIKPSSIKKRSDLKQNPEKVENSARLLEKKLTELAIEKRRKEIGTSRTFNSGQDFPRSSTAGVLAIRFSGLRDIIRDFGYQFADNLTIILADILTKNCPEQAVAARTGDFEFAVELPSASKTLCKKLSTRLVEALNKAYIEHPLKKGKIHIKTSVGYALYPQDITGATFLQPASELARLLLRKARLAAALANEESKDWNGIKGVMGFGTILAEGGRVIEVLPLSRVTISLGAAMNAREGQRFSVWSIQMSQQRNEDKAHVTPFYKGEIAIMEVQENTSFAEVIHLGEPTWSIEAGDRLVLLPDIQNSTKRKEEGIVHHDPVTGFLRYGDFLAQWSQLREKAEFFFLALVRIEPKHTLRPDLQDSKFEREDHTFFVSKNSQPDRLMSEVAGLFRDTFGHDICAGRYGLNSLIFYHEHILLEEVKKKYTHLIEIIEERVGLNMAVGISIHPYLNYRRPDALENCQKALEYAVLLPKPHIGVLDSVALNISADKKFSHGDTFGAIREYQMALLADEQNGLAWNSLGICFASLGKKVNSEECFFKALECSPKDAMALYNLGHIFQSLDQYDQAVEFYQSCLKHKPDHVYSLIRLGQISEAKGNHEQAREYFEQAKKKPGGEGLTYHHFARLCLAEGKDNEAREHLHSALIHNPQDAIALQLLAKVYLDAGEDPELAASLAKQSVSLRPSYKTAWFELAKALEAMGKNEQAREARLKAGGAL